VLASLNESPNLIRKPQLLLFFALSGIVVNEQSWKEFSKSICQLPAKQCCFQFQITERFITRAYPQILLTRILFHVTLRIFSPKFFSNRIWIRFYLNKVSWLTMRSVAWNRFLTNKICWLIRLVTFVETSYLNIDLCKFGSLQSCESRA